MKPQDVKAAFDAVFNGEQIPKTRNIVVVKPVPILILSSGEEDAAAAARPKTKKRKVVEKVVKKASKKSAIQREDVHPNPNPNPQEREELSEGEIRMIREANRLRGLDQSREDQLFRGEPRVSDDEESEESDESEEEEEEEDDEEEEKVAVQNRTKVRVKGGNSGK